MIETPHVFFEAHTLMKKRMVDRQLESMFVLGEGMQPRFTWIGFPWFLLQPWIYTSPQYMGKLHRLVGPFVVSRNSSFNQHKEKT